MKCEQLQQAYRHACELELKAFKPGNVSIYSPAHDMTADDFRLSAKVSAEPLTQPAYSLGEKIYYAVKATQEAVGCNTNLGIILLCAPLLSAATAVKKGESLRQALSTVLNATSIEDANWVFKAICLAAPAGLGNSAQQDVTQSAQVTLTQAMEFAKNRDRIALQYVTDFKDIFDFAISAYNGAFNCFFDESLATLAIYVALLNRYPDSHVERKYGNRYNEQIKQQMVKINHALYHSNRLELMDLLTKVDADFKSKKINPGTTADLTVATLLVIFLDELLGVNH